MKRTKHIVNLAAGALLLGSFLAACDDEDGGIGNVVDGGIVDGSSVATIDTAVAPKVDGDIVPVQTDGGDADAATIPTPASGGIAVVLSDYTSISLTLVNPDTGAVVKEKCVTSGTVAPGLSLAFSGDVVLPSSPLAGGKIVLIDRKNGTLTWIDPADCKVTRQISVATGFFANPHDAAQIGDLIFVSRHETNAAPTAATTDFDEGNDVLVVDAKTGLPVGRIDLAPFATTAAKTVLARPDRLLVKNGLLYVSLANVGPNFAVDEIGAGRVVVIDPLTRNVTGMLDASPLANCGGIQTLVGTGGILLSCNGNFALMDGTQINGSGIVWGTAGAAPMVLPASAFGRPASFSDVVLATATKGFVIVPGNFGGKPNDLVWAFDLETKAVKSVFEGKSGFVVVNLLWNHRQKQLYIAHADPARPRIVVLNAADPANPTPGAEIDPTAATGLPPVALGWY
jgi:hypothetical protein